MKEVAAAKYENGEFDTDEVGETIDTDGDEANDRGGEESDESVLKNDDEHEMTESDQDQDIDSDAWMQRMGRRVPLTRLDEMFRHYINKHFPIGAVDVDAFRSCSCLVRGKNQIFWETCQKNCRRSSVDFWESFHEEPTKSLHWPGTPHLEASHTDS